MSRPARRFLLAALGALALGLLAAPARAQVEMGAGVGPDVFDRLSEPKKKPSFASPLALAMSLVLDASSWARIMVSSDAASAAPADELGRLLHGGYYKLELLQLALMAADSGSPFKDLLKRRDDKKSLRQIAAELSLPFESYYDRAVALAAEADRRMESLRQVSVLSPAPSSASPRAAGRRDLRER